MVINDSFYIKISLNFIQHGTNIGSGSWVGGLKVIPLLASTELGEEMSPVEKLCDVKICQQLAACMGYPRIKFQIDISVYDGENPF